MLGLSPQQPLSQCAPGQCPTISCHRPLSELYAQPWIRAEQKCLDINASASSFSQGRIALGGWILQISYASGRTALSCVLQYSPGVNQQVRISVDIDGKLFSNLSLVLGNWLHFLRSFEGHRLLQLGYKRWFGWNNDLLCRMNWAFRVNPRHPTLPNACRGQHHPQSRSVNRSFLVCSSFDILWLVYQWRPSGMEQYPPSHISLWKGSVEWCLLNRLYDVRNNHCLALKRGQCLTQSFLLP